MQAPMRTHVSRTLRLVLVLGFALAAGVGTPAHATIKTVLILTVPSSVNLTATYDCSTTFCATIDYSSVLSVSDSDYPADQVSIICNNPRGNVYSWGMSMTTCYAQDPANNRSADQMFQVNVSVPVPTIQNVPAPTFAATGPAGGVATWVNPTATDVGGQSVPVQCDHTSGLTYPVGTTQVTCTAQIQRNDSQGNPIGGLPSSTAQFNVTITPQGSGGGGSGGGGNGNGGTGAPSSPSSTDTTAPTIAAHGAIVVDATSPTGAVVKYAISTSDPDNSVAQITLSCSPASGQTFHLGADGKTKTTTVTCQAHDPAGNAATPTTFTVKVLGVHDQLQALELRINASAVSVTRKVLLVSPLAAADRAFRAGKRGQATKDLESFVREAHALPLGASARRAWLAAATRLLAVTG